MAEKGEEAKPLGPSAAVYPTETFDEEGAMQWRSAQYLRKRRGVLFCCGCCGVLVVVLGLVALVLALTAFKVKDPVLTMNSIHFSGLRVGGPGPVNATLTADVSIKNPNMASYEFRNSTTELYYGGKVVAVARAPGGEVAAHRTVRLNVTVDVMADRVAGLGIPAVGFLAAGSVNLTTRTEINGRVNMFGVFRRELDVFLNCSMTMDLSLTEQGVKDKVCTMKTE
uniref:Peptidyl-tRNA hydrolase n=1 Tax=Anthurium amnicola TaxID=1678845 RepID=A0A1D1Y648_9ARAE